MEVINHQDGQEPALALNQENGHLVYQENGLVNNHAPNGVTILRRSYSIKEKRDIVQAVQTLAANGVSVHQACSMVGLPHQYYYRFKKAVKTADDLEKSGVFIHYKCNGGARKLHPSRPSILAAILDNLSKFVCETRVQGIQVSTHMVRHEACRLLPTSMGKSINAREKTILCFTKTMSLSHCAATHTAQKNYQETMESPDTSLQ